MNDHTPTACTQTTQWMHATRVPLHWRQVLNVHTATAGIFAGLGLGWMGLAYLLGTG